MHGLGLAEDDALERFFERAQPFPVRGRRLTRRNPGNPRDDALDIGGVDDGRGRRGSIGRNGRIDRRGRNGSDVQPRDRARLVDQIDRAVGQAIVAQVPRRELDGGFERGVGVGDAMVLLVPASQPGENADGLVYRRFVDRDLLQPPREGAILFDVLEFFERRRSDDAEVARGQDRLDERCEVHRAARGRAGADCRMNLVDEEDRFRPRAERLDDRLESLLEVAAESRAGEQAAGIEREHLRLLQRLRHFVSEKPHRQPFGHGRFADAGLADEYRVVLAPPA